MGVDIPAAAVSSVLKEQEQWGMEKLRSSKGNLHKRLATRSVVIT